MIRLKDAEKTYENGTKAVRGISFQIDDGEFVFLVGPSGSGKTTLVKLMLGFYTPGKGSIRLGETPLGMINPHLWRAKSGAVMQD